MVVVGLDPGGAGAFGWCVVEDDVRLPLRIRAAGVSDDARRAVDAVGCVAAGSEIVAVGIDAPMFWATSGERAVDDYLRTEIRKRGAHGATVNHVNSLRGACLVQGLVAAMLLRRRAPGLPITEAHPKAALWMLADASATMKVAAVTTRALTNYIEVGTHAMASEHERDAAIGALTAWAMVHRAEGWEDIRGRDGDALSVLGEPVAYWMPMVR